MTRIAATLYVALLAIASLPSTAHAGRPYAAQVVVGSAPGVQLVPVFAFFRVGEAARAQAIRDEAYRAGYSQGRAEANATLSSRGEPSASPSEPKAEASVRREAVAPASVNDAHAAAEQVLRRACVRCHSGPTAAGEVDLASPGAAAEQRLSAFKAAYTGRMPPNGPPLSDDDVRVLLESLVADESPAKP